MALQSKLLPSFDNILCTHLYAYDVTEYFLAPTPFSFFVSRGNMRKQRVQFFDTHDKWTCLIYTEEW